MSLHSAPAHAAASRDATEPACTSNAWPNLPALDFGRVTPGSMSSSTESFVVPGGGSVSASVADGSAVFRVGGIETDTVTKQRAADNPGEMPPGYHGPRFHFETVCTLDTSVDGSGPVTAKPGEMVNPHGREPTTSDIAPTGTLAVSVDSATRQVQISMFVGGIKADLELGSLHILQGRSAISPPPSPRSAEPTPTRPSIYTTPCPALRSPIRPSHVPAGQTVHASLHVVVAAAVPWATTTSTWQCTPSRIAPAKSNNLLGLGSLTITVDPLPVQTFTIPLGVAKTVWDSARDAACERQGSHRSGGAQCHRQYAIEDPHCYFAPLQLTASQSGNQLTITGYAPGNWVDFAVTTPTGSPDTWALTRNSRRTSMSPPRSPCSSPPWTGRHRCGSRRPR